MCTGLTSFHLNVIPNKFGNFATVDLSTHPHTNARLETIALPKASLLNGYKVSKSIGRISLY